MFGSFLGGLFSGIGNLIGNRIQSKFGGLQQNQSFIPSSPFNENPTINPEPQYRIVPHTSPERATLGEMLTRGATQMMGPTIEGSVKRSQIPNSGFKSASDALGSIASKYESAGDPATISMAKGDLGGASYGNYQLSAKMGSLQGFLSDSGYEGLFAGMQPGSERFNNQWREMSRDPIFVDAQHRFIKEKFYSPVRSKADELGIPNTPAINEALWSTSVQHGQGGAAKILQRSYEPGISEKGLIKNIYQNRARVFRNSRYYNKTPARRNIRDNVIKRYRREYRDIIGMM